MEAGTQTTALPAATLPATRFRMLALLLFICGASAGVHATLIPEHLREEPPLGVAFVLAVALQAWPRGSWRYRSRTCPGGWRRCC